MNQYASLPEIGIGGRHNHLARELAALGHKVVVVAAKWTHLVRDKVANEQAPDIQEFEGYRFVRIPVMRYSGAHDWKRIMNWFIFAWRIQKVERLVGFIPDVVLYSSPSLVGFLGAERLAKRNRAKLVFEVRDFWPRTLVELGGYSPKHPFVRFLQLIEDRAYRISDFCVSNVQNAYSHMEMRGLAANKFAWIANGFSFTEIMNSQPLPAETATALSSTVFRIGYTGTVGVANSLDTLIDVANILKDHKELEFTIIGDGKEKSRLRKMVDDLKLDNVKFVEAIPKPCVQAAIMKFDVCFIAWKNSPLYEYGIAANKLFDYFVSGKPIVHCYSGFGDPVENYRAGITVAAENPAAAAKAILAIRSLSPGEQLAMGANGRAAAIEHHEYGNLARKLEAVLLNLVKQ